MEAVAENNENLKEIVKTIKKLKLKENSLKEYSVKLAKDYYRDEEKIKNANFNEVKTCTDIENLCTEGLYKEHILLEMEPQMEKFYKEFSYRKLIDMYEDMIDEYQCKTGKIAGAHFKKELIYNTKTKEIDMLSRQFASSNFQKIKLLKIADFSKKDLEKLYKKSKEIITEELKAILPSERELTKDNYLGKLQYVLSNYYYETYIQKQEQIEKTKKNLWQKIKELFNRNKPKLLEESSKIKNERKINNLQEILKNIYHENEDAGCFKEGKIEDKIKIMQMDEENSKETEKYTERREVIKEGKLIKI